MVDSARSLFRPIYKTGMIIVTLTLGGGAVLAYASATPGNGLLLVAGILALLTLIAGLSINKLDWQDQQAEAYRQIGEDIRDRIKLATRYSYAEPEVHHLDAAMVEEAKRMAAEGAPIDDICTAIDPGHGGHEPAHREAFRRVVRAMIDS